MIHHLEPVLVVHHREAPQKFAGRSRVIPQLSPDRDHLLRLDGHHYFIQGSTHLGLELLERHFQEGSQGLALLVQGSLGLGRLWVASRPFGGHAIWRPA